MIMIAVGEWAAGSGDNSPEFRPMYPVPVAMFFLLFYPLL